MKLTAQEQLVAFVMLARNAKNETRTYPMSQLPTAISAQKKLNAVATTEGEKVSFTPEAELDFGTEEKKLLLDSLDREWDLTVAEAVLTLKEKLA